MINTVVADIPGLNSKERTAYVRLLELGSAKVSILGRATGLPRTSLYPILERLEEKGFVQRIRVGNHEEWEADGPKEIYKVAKDALGKFSALLPDLEKIRGRLSVKPQRISEVFFYRNRAGLKKAYWDALRMPKGSRIYSIEGSKSVEAKLRHFSWEEGRKWQTDFNKSGIIMEAIFGERSLKSYEKVPDDQLNLYTNRLVIGTALPDNLMELDTDIFCYGNTVAIMIVEKDTVVIINSPEIAETFRNLFRIIQQLGRKVDLNAYVKALATRREK